MNHYLRSYHGEFFRVKKATTRIAGLVKKCALVVHLDGKNFMEAKASIEDLAKPGNLNFIRLAGVSLNGNWIFLFRGLLWIRYMTYELTSGRRKMSENKGRLLSWSQADWNSSDRHYSGDIAWGGKGKFALKPFRGKMREEF